ncbi:16S rRNA (adenine(1518)-N(6)/adenine(1519)-N(6))-dimethyltransferase RsmA [Halothiobacillus sp. DCM-1]|uniref:16S rRNA (adenine(1518)-N(6)/adenine(1519)-N(6))- dimethyltransferase RsmA n=1 Tax=Halothiobacillus sp. DCM-1 TaxID=3112558 RepID=UPI0032448D2C
MTRPSTQTGIEDGHRARKRFGQNFLTDAGVIAQIVSAIAPKQSDVMLEIGPGLGALTCALLPHLPALTVVELDRDLIPKLKTRCQAAGMAEKLTVRAEDALQLSLTPNGQRQRIVGNLPYNIGTPLIFHLLDQAAHIQDMTFMLQKEVVDRLAAEPGSRDYGRLSLTVQARAAVEPLFIVPPTAFNPPPKVDSAIVRLTPHLEPRVPPALWPTFNELVTLAFSQRRKTLGNTLKPLRTADELLAAGIDPIRRAETLDLDDFLRLARQRHR